MVELAPFALFVRLLPCVFLLWLAWIVGRSNFPNGSNRWLGGFFAVVAFGFLFQFLFRLLAPVAGDASTLLQVSENLLGALDPPILLAFSLALSQSRLLFARWLWLVYALLAPITFLFFLGALSVAFLQTGAWFPILYVNGTYLAAFAFLLQAYLREPYKFRERQLFFIVVAIGFAAFSRSGAFFFNRLRSADAASGFVLPSVVLATSLLVLFWGASRILARTSARRTNAVFAWLFFLLAAFAVAYYLIVLGDDVLGFQSNLRVQYFSLRWLVVAGVLGYGVVRHQLFDYGLRTRQALSFVSALALGVVAAFAAALQAQTSGSSQSGAHWVGLAAGFATSIGVYHVMAWAWRRKGTDLPASYRRRRLELYEAALEFSLGHREWTLPERLFADTLRAVFEITPEEHERVLESLRRSSSGSLPEPPAGTTV